MKRSFLEDKDLVTIELILVLLNLETPYIVKANLLLK